MILTTLNQRKTLLDECTDMEEQVNVLEKMTGSTSVGEKRGIEEVDDKMESEEPSAKKQRTASESEKSRLKPIALVPPRMLSRDMKGTVSPSTNVTAKKAAGRPRKKQKEASSPTTKESLTEEASVSSLLPKEDKRHEIPLPVDNGFHLPLPHYLTALSPFGSPFPYFPSPNMSVYHAAEHRLGTPSPFELRDPKRAFTPFDPEEKSFYSATKSMLEMNKWFNPMHYGHHRNNTLEEHLQLSGQNLPSCGLPQYPYQYPKPDTAPPVNTTLPSYKGRRTTLTGDHSRGSSTDSVDSTASFNSSPHCSQSPFSDSLHVKSSGYSALKSPRNGHSRPKADGKRPEHNIGASSLGSWTSVPHSPHLSSDRSFGKSPDADMSGKSDSIPLSRSYNSSSTESPVARPPSRQTSERSPRTIAKSAKSKCPEVQSFVRILNQDSCKSLSPISESCLSSSNSSLSASISRKELNKSARPLTQLQSTDTLRLKEKVNQVTDKATPLPYSSASGSSSDLSKIESPTLSFSTLRILGQPTKKKSSPSWIPIQGAQSPTLKESAKAKAVSVSTTPKQSPLNTPLNTPMSPLNSPLNTPLSDLNAVSWLPANCKLIGNKSPEALISKEGSPSNDFKPVLDNNSTSLAKDSLPNSIAKELARPGKPVDASHKGCMKDTVHKSSSTETHGSCSSIRNLPVQNGGGLSQAGVSATYAETVHNKCSSTETHGSFSSIRNLPVQNGRGLSQAGVSATYAETVHKISTTDTPGSCATTRNFSTPNVRTSSKPGASTTSAVSVGSEAANINSALTFLRQIAAGSEAKQSTLASRMYGSGKTSALDILARSSVMESGKSLIISASNKVSQPGSTSNERSAFKPPTSSTTLRPDSVVHIGIYKKPSTSQFLSTLESCAKATLSTFQRPSTIKPTQTTTSCSSSHTGVLSTSSSAKIEETNRRQTAPEKASYSISNEANQKDVLSGRTVSTASQGSGRTSVLTKASNESENAFKESVGSVTSEGPHKTSATKRGARKLSRVSHSKAPTGRNLFPSTSSVSNSNVLYSPFMTILPGNSPLMVLPSHSSSNSTRVYYINAPPHINSSTHVGGSVPHNIRPTTPPTGSNIRPFVSTITGNASSCTRPSATSVASNITHNIRPSTPLVTGIATLDSLQNRIVRSVPSAVTPIPSAIASQNPHPPRTSH